MRPLRRTSKKQPPRGLLTGKLLLLIWSGHRLPGARTNRHSMRFNLIRPEMVDQAPTPYDFPRLGDFFKQIGFGRPANRIRKFKRHRPTAAVGVK